MAFGLRRAAEPAITPGPISGRRDPRSLLEQVDFFRGLDERILKQLAEAVIERQYAPDEIIVRQGEMGLGLYVILKGKVKVEEDNNGTLTKVAELGTEQFFAEMSIVDNKPRSANVTTMEETECLLLTRDSFVSLMQKYPELPIRVARLLAERLRIANEKLAAAARGEKPAAGTPGPAATGGPAPATAPATAPADAPAAGESRKPAEGAAGMKASVQSTLLDAFQYFYSLKAMTRFSVAVLGCPVEGRSPDVIEEIRVGDVKVLILPAAKPVDLDIEAFDSGSFTLTVLTPGERGRTTFGPLPVDVDSGYQLRLGRGGAPQLTRR